MMHKKGQADFWSIVWKVILMLVILVVLLMIFGRRFGWFVEATECKGYCVANQGECPTKVTHDSKYCERYSNNKPYCCVDSDYRGDPAGTHSTAGVNPYLTIANEDGTPVEHSKPVTFIKDTPQTLTFGYNHDDAGDCIVTARDNNFNPGKMISDSTRFNCKEKTKITFTFGQEYVGKTNLNIDMIVLKKGKEDNVAGNWLTSMKKPMVVIPGTPEQRKLARNDKPFKGQTIYFGNEFTPVNALQYVDYPEEHRSELVCSWEVGGQYRGKEKLAVEQDGCVFTISPDIEKIAPQQNTLDFTIQSPNEDVVVLEAMFTVFYTPEEYCKSQSDDEIGCIVIGCIYRDEECVLDCTQEGGPCELGIYELYCSRFTPKTVCNNWEEGYCIWDDNSETCIPMESLA